jgi:aspartate kinase
VGHLALPDDGVSFSGINSLFHFFLPDPHSTGNVEAHRLHSCKERKELFGTGYKWLDFDRVRIEEIIESLFKLSIAQSEKNAVEVEAARLFSTDLVASLSSCESRRVSFANFVNAYNRNFVRRYFPERAFFTGFLSQVATFLTSGVRDWPRYVGWLVSKGLIGKGESLARLRVERDDKPHRYVTLVLEALSPCSVLVKNRDTEVICDIRQLAEASYQNLTATGSATLVPTMISNYLVIYGMSNSLCLVDGAPFAKAEQLSKLLSNPNHSGVSQQQLTTLGYTGLLAKEPDTDPYKGLIPCYSVLDYYKPIASFGILHRTPSPEVPAVQKACSNDLIVAKFGGSSVGTVERILQVVEIVAGNSSYRVVVVSAYQGVTNELIEVARTASNGDSERVQKILDSLWERHRQIAEEVLSGCACQSTLSSLRALHAELVCFIRQNVQCQTLTLDALDHIMSFGERFSALTLSTALKIRLPNYFVEYVDARDIVRTDNKFGSAHVDFGVTNSLVANRIQAGSHQLSVVTGFIGATQRGNTTTLGRGGSDYTAAILGAALGAKEIAIWTDVNGILTADPRKVPHALPLENLTYEEAWSLCSLGAKVVYPQTLLPAARTRIPIRILNTLDPTYKGTLISDSVTRKDSQVTGISSIEKVALIKFAIQNLEASTKVLETLHAALRGTGVEVLMSSDLENSDEFALVVLPHHGEIAKSFIDEWLRTNIKSSQENTVEIAGYHSIISLVGPNNDNLKVAWDKSNSLVKDECLVMLSPTNIASAGSSGNVSFAVDCRHEVQTLNRLHEKLFSH